METIRVVSAEGQMRWVRDPNGILGGVCSGVAKQLNMEPWLVRMIWLASIFVFGTGILAYLLCLISLPRADRQQEAQQKMVLGVCARIHQRGDMEVGLARLVALCLLLGSFGAAIVGYIVLYFILTQPAKT